MFGFGFHETLSGTYHHDEGDRPMSVTLDVRAANLATFLMDREAVMEGHVEAEGLATHAPLTGVMRIDPLLGRVIGYRFTFSGDDGKSYRFEGRKEVQPLKPVESMTTLRGELTNESDGLRVGDAVLYFDVTTLPAFLKSFHPVM